MWAITMEKKETSYGETEATGYFHTDESALKLLFLVLNLAQEEWRMPPREWAMAKAQFAIIFEGRFKLA